MEFTLFLMRFVPNVCYTAINPIWQVVFVGGMRDRNLARAALNVGQAKVAGRILARRQVNLCGIRIAIVTFPDVLEHLVQINTVSFFNLLDVFRRHALALMDPPRAADKICADPL